MPDSSEKSLARQCALLSVTAESTWQDVRCNYRRLVQEWHPDRHIGFERAAAQDRFIVINSAYKDLKRYYQMHGTVPNQTIENIDERPIFMERKQDRIPSHIKFKLKTGVSLFFALIACLVLLWWLDVRLVEHNRDSARVQRSATVQNGSEPTLPARYEKVGLPRDVH